MGIVRVTDREGKVHDLEAAEGWRVMEIIRDWGLDLPGTCGGACECGTCHVKVDEKWLDRIPPMREEEEDQLDNLPIIHPNSRLSCQIIWSEELDGLEVTLAEKLD